MKAAATVKPATAAMASQAVPSLGCLRCFIESLIQTLFLTSAFVNGNYSAICQVSVVYLDHGVSSNSAGSSRAM